MRMQSGLGCQLITLAALYSVEKGQQGRNRESRATWWEAIEIIHTQDDGGFD